MKRDYAARAAEHIKFWKGEKTDGALASFRIGDYFFASHYKAAVPLLVRGKKILPEMIEVDSFMEDYENQYAAIQGLGQPGFWTAEPYTGIPWMEAFWGCDILGGEKSFTAEPLARSPEDLKKLRFSMDNPWVEKYFEFVRKLNALSAGRFPVGAPIMRGPGDVGGALLGQTQFIYSLYDEAAAVKDVLAKITSSFLQINERMLKENTPFLGGSSMGLYHVWAPGPSIWFQDDISALLSPDLYREFLLDCEKRICASCDYTMMHLHPSSFHLLDDLLSNGGLKAVEINKDVGGPGIAEMLPQFKKVLASGRRLIIWGDLTGADLKTIFAGLPSEGVFFNILLPSLTAAEKISRELNFLGL
jgi:hypothetical protein